MTIILLLLFAAFGAVCGVYLSVVGFVVTTIVVFGGLALLNVVTAGVMTPGFLVLAFACAQVGFFVAAMAPVLRGALRQTRGPREPADTSAPLEREQPR